MNDDAKHDAQMPNSVLSHSSPGIQAPQMTRRLGGNDIIVESLHLRGVREGAIGSANLSVTRRCGHRHDRSASYQCEWSQRAIGASEGGRHSASARRLLLQEGAAKPAQPAAMLAR
jgi:hypothetical protein